MASPTERERGGFEALRRRFLAGVPDRVATLKQATREARRRWPSRDGIERLQQHAHRLVGASEIFGVPRVSEAARALEDLARQLLEGGPGIQRLGELLASLEAASSETTPSRRRCRRP
jgi:HPt (histidine-containing phosphotransfer) domain-containing protein